jgi:hypothetical protein
MEDVTFGVVDHTTLEHIVATPQSKAPMVYENVNHNGKKNM